MSNEQEILHKRVINKIATVIELPDEMLSLAEIKDSTIN